MKNKDYVTLLEKLRKELHRRYGRDICKELHAGCYGCQINIMIGQINNEIDLNS